jgi:predicted metal-dependent enzyme (double-stranded beta helix superfamily)
MCDTGYSIKQLVADLRELKRRAATEAQMVAAVPDLARRMMLAKHAWLRPSMCQPNAAGEKAGVYTLHEEPDHSLAAFVVTWLPGDETPPHDHATWAVIAGLDGHETNHWWTRTDDRSVPGRAVIRRAGKQRIDATTVIAMRGDAIHSLHNDSGGVSITLHLYGVNVDFTDRYKYDPERHVVAPYRLGGRVHANASSTTQGGSR